MLRGFFGDGKFYAVLLKIALPITAQSLVAHLLNAVDVLLIGQKGETAVAAVALSNQWSLLINVLLLGVGGGTAIFTAQYWGNQDLPRLRRAFGLGLLIGVVSGILFAATAMLLPWDVLRLYTSDAAVVALGAPYLRLVGLSYFFLAFTTVFGVTLRSTRHVKLPVIVSVCALSFKTIVAYGLIFGRLGLPELGITGAAVATVVARALECIVLLSLTYRWHLPPALMPSDMRGINRAFTAMFAAITVPVILNELIWALGSNVYTGIYARISTESVAAINIATTIENVALVPMFGLGNACAIILGNAIGAGNSGQARDYSHRFLALAFTIGLLVGGLMLSTSRSILGAYNISPEATMFARRIMMVMGLALWLKACNLLVVMGILRSGGDTRFCLAIDAGSMWLAGIPVALLGAFVLRLPVYFVVVLVVLGDELTKFLLGMWRVRSGRWLRNVAAATKS